MSLHLVLGACGSGKSTYVFDEILRQAAERRDDAFLVLVPDQFSQGAQRLLVESSKKRETEVLAEASSMSEIEGSDVATMRSGAILNIDVLSFHRLAYRAFEEVRSEDRRTLNDEGKIMLLRKVIAEHRGELLYFTKGLDTFGFLDECKSFLSECMEYSIDAESLEGLREAVGEDTALGCKLHDIRLLYDALLEKMGQTYRMSEELIPLLASLVTSLSFLKGVTICLDGFTGFTPAQYQLLAELMRVCRDMYVTVTTDRDSIGKEGKRADIFSLSNDTIFRLTQTAREAGIELAEPVVTGCGEEKGSYRLQGNLVINHLEKYLFSNDKTRIIVNEKYKQKEIIDNIANKVETSDKKIQINSSEINKKENQDLECLSKGIRLRACRRPADEAAFTAREIARLVREGAHYSDFAVVTGTPEEYEPHLISAFDKMNIKYFADHKKSLGANPLAEYIGSFLYMNIYGFDTEHVVRFLRGILSPLEKDETDIFENYIIASGRRGYAIYEEAWTYDANSARLPLDEINTYRSKFTDAIGETVEELRGGAKTVKEFTLILYKLLTKNNIYKKLKTISGKFEEDGDIILAKEYKKLYGAMMSVLDELVDLLGDEKVSLREYTQILLAGISEGVVGFVPPSGDAVLIGDVERSRLPEVKYVFLLGNNDDIFPRGSSSKGIISEAERLRIESEGTELAPSAERLYQREQFYLYMLLSKPRETLYLTYSKTGSDGTSKRPSYLISKVRALFEGDYPIIEDDEGDETAEAIVGLDRGKGYLLRGIYGSDEDDSWRELAAYYKRNDRDFFDRISSEKETDKRASYITAGTAELLYGEPMYASVTRFETYALCPYAHYLTYGLKVRDRERFVPDPRDRGNIFHDALETFTKGLMEKNIRWQELDDAQIESLAEESLEAVVNGYRNDIFSQDKRTSYMARKIKKVYTDSVKHLAYHMKSGDFIQSATEVAFPDEVSEGEMSMELKERQRLILHGRIDRIDTADEDDRKYIKIIDYKSSRRTLSIGEIYYGLQLQLFTYLKAATSMRTGKKNIPAATLYFAVDEKETDWTPVLEDKDKLAELERAGFRTEGFVNSDAGIYTKLDRSLEQGGVKSVVVPITTTKSGAPHSSWSKVLSTEQFDRLMEHTADCIRADGEEIYAGKICAQPALYHDKAGCDFCAYAGVCGAESRTISQMTRKLKSIKDDEVWEALDGDD